MNNEKIVSILNGLLQISRDGGEGFKTCADDVSDSALKMYFLNRAQSWDQIHHTLSAEVRNYGGNPNPSGTATGVLHRTWIDIKTGLTKQDNLAVLEECERGEAVALMAYENALRQEIPDNLRVLLERQYEEVKKDHDRVRQLRDEARNNPDLA